jgi:hypothetical protein
VKLFIYMNEKIRARRPGGPVIRVQHGNNPANFVEGNLVIINGPSVVRFDPRGLPIAEDHRVTAWIEADARDVVVR